MENPSTYNLIYSYYRILRTLIFFSFDIKGMFFSGHCPRFTMQWWASSWKTTTADYITLELESGERRAS